jgi:hypothetical protein
VALLQNALAAASLSESEVNSHVVTCLYALIIEFFKTGAWNEAEPLVPRYREAAKVESRRMGLSLHELRSLYFSARLQQVVCPPVLGTPSH